MQKTIIQEHLREYLNASVPRKSQIITHIMYVSGMQQRKSVVRAFSREQHRSGWKAPPRLGRPRVYTAETDAALAFVWEQYHYPSAERLHPIVSEAVRIFRRDGMWQYSEHATSQLVSMSLGAMKPRCTSLAKRHGLLRGISTTKASPLVRAVPVFFGSWKDKGAGHGQVDTVVHCGSKLMGDMVYTVNYIDVATCWVEPVAQLNKTERATTRSMETVRQRLPWELKELHPDSGSEFLNDLAIRWARANNIAMTRSRPSKKNDNAFVEQKNRSVVRAYVGYGRYDCIEAVDTMNELYKTLRLYINFFQPTYKLQGKEKRVLKADGNQAAKPYKRIYDTPATPYARALARDDVPGAVKQCLRQQYETLNPKTLQDTIQVLTTRLERIQREHGSHD